MYLNPKRMGMKFLLLSQRGQGERTSVFDGLGIMILAEKQMRGIRLHVLSLHAGQAVPLGVPTRRRELSDDERPVHSGMVGELEPERSRLERTHLVRDRRLVEGDIATKRLAPSNM
jgi:hypothetical protein